MPGGRVLVAARRAPSSQGAFMEAATALLSILLLLVASLSSSTAAAAAVPAAAATPASLALEPPVWPETLTATLLQNLTERLALTELFYEFPKGRNLNLIRSQLGAHGTVWDVEHDNGASSVVC